MRGEWDGANLGHRGAYGAAGHRFIATPFNLAISVHHDALYQAYLHACLILLGFNAPFDPGLPFK